jgi:ion channel
MHAFGHFRELARPQPREPRHSKLRRRVGEALVLVGIADAFGTFGMWFFESDAQRSEIHNIWDAFFFSTVQLLTVSSQMRNPVTTGGRIVDILLELVAICVVSGLAGAFASFFLAEGKESPGEPTTVR